jgi:hypothetical protein
LRVARVGLSAPNFTPGSSALGVTSRRELPVDRPYPSPIRISNLSGASDWSVFAGSITGLRGDSSPTTFLCRCLLNNDFAVGESEWLQRWDSQCHLLINRSLDRLTILHVRISTHFLHGLLNLVISLVSRFKISARASRMRRLKSIER